MMRSKELQEVARLRSGEDFGERGIIDEDRGNRVRTAHAITTQPCVLATLHVIQRKCHLTMPTTMHPASAVLRAIRPIPRHMCH